MKFEVKENKEVDVKYLSCACGVRYWEDAIVNGVEDEEGTLIPCRQGGDWAPVIEVDTGVILDWPKGTVADIHYKVCDDGSYTLESDDKLSIKTISGYVPSIMCPGGNGYGDYVIMSVDEDGKIKDWNADFSDFERDDND